jgi:hypothetical protein
LDWSDASELRSPDRVREASISEAHGIVLVASLERWLSLPALSIDVTAK